MNALRILLIEDEARLANSVKQGLVEPRAAPRKRRKHRAAGKSPRTRQHDVAARDQW